MRSIQVAPHKPHFDNRLTGNTELGRFAIQRLNHPRREINIHKFLGREKGTDPNTVNVYVPFGTHYVSLLDTSDAIGFHPQHFCLQDTKITEITKQKQV